MRCVLPSSPRSAHHRLLLVLLTSRLVCGLAVPHETLKGVPERGEVGHEGLKRPTIHRQDRGCQVKCVTFFIPAPALRTASQID